MTRLVLLLLLLARASAACVADGETEAWTGTIGTRHVDCCARHGLHSAGRASYLDDVTLWCSPAVRRAVFVSVDTDRQTGVPVSTESVACRRGPRFRRPRNPVKPPPPPPLRGSCCAVTGITIGGAFSGGGSSGGAFLPLTGRVTALGGSFDCPRPGRHHPRTAVPFALSAQ